jgi:hypothetical protein
MLTEFFEGAELTGDRPAVTRLRSRTDLCKLFASLAYKRGAEIGVWAGEFSEVICRLNPGVHLIGVDPWLQYKHYNEKKNNQGRLDQAYAEAQERVKPYDCELWRTTSLKAAARVPDGSLDFVYLDGNHAKAFVEQDLAAWVPKVRSGGILSGHDYTFNTKKPWIQDVKPAVDAFTLDRNITRWYVLAQEKAPSFFWVVE